MLLPGTAPDNRERHSSVLSDRSSASRRDNTAVKRTAIFRLLRFSSFLSDFPAVPPLLPTVCVTIRICFGLDRLLFSFFDFLGLSIYSSQLTYKG